MKVTLKIAVLQICLAAALTAQTANARPRDTKPQLLSRNQGQAVANFALREGSAVRPKPDCSHLVHMLYSRAGLSYPYQGSRVLHRGIPAFAHVKTPQAGDLAVWRGHVGIVLSPRDKTFISSVRSGIITESWTNDYWSARGRPRFLRYIVGPQTDLALLEEVNTRREPEVATASVGTSLAARQTERTAQAEVEGTPQAEEPRAVTEPADPITSFAEADDGQKQPSIIAVAVIQQRSKPDKADITAAFRQGGLDLSRALSNVNGGVLDPERPISIVERLEVKQVKISHDHGVLRLKLVETLTLDQGKIRTGITTERELALNHRDGVWVISDPRERLYIPRDKAVDVLENQLHLILENGSPKSEERAIVKALNLLYDREAAISKVTAEPQR
ncbi:MAG TPA: CHAP domain-containing protein [Candidatus Angelobacter sp.]|nr:CHAP domain-containing protein [Candidatus Angelobacter sp.]